MSPSEQTSTSNAVAPSAATQHLNPLLLPNAKENLPKTAPFDQELPWVLEFRIVGTSEIMQIKVRDSLLIGRTDFDRNIFPEIDLTPYNGGVFGVSRRHAMITVHENRLMIQDLNSTNGTNHNGSRLEPFKEVRLRHGDELVIGGLQLQLQFSVVPSEMDTKPPTAPLTYDATIPTVGRGQRVLVIEDDDSVGEVFRRALEVAGFQVTLVPTVVQGLGVCFHQMPDAIILNVMMADMNGLDLVRYVRKTTTMRRIPIIVLSPTNGGYYKNQAYNAGADVFMNKPVNVEDLVRSIGSAVV